MLDWLQVFILVPLARIGSFMGFEVPELGVQGHSQKCACSNFYSWLLEGSTVCKQMSRVRLTICFSAKQVLDLSSK